MSTTIEPTVGRVVLVFAAAGTPIDGYALPAAGTPLAGLITYVHNDSCINVAAFDANGENLPITSVRLLQGDEKRPSIGFWAEWMPYQKQQAEKHANEPSPIAEVEQFAADLTRRAHQVAAHAAMVRESGWTPGNGAGQQQPTTGLTFGTALTALKTGQRVARAGWNGKGMFAYLVPANSYPAQTGAAKAFFGEGGMVPYNAYLALKGADDTVSTWAPSGSDALAEDWLIVE